VGVSTGDSVMMGRQTGDQSQLFYLFNLEKRIPARHCTRAPFRKIVHIDEDTHDYARSLKDTRI
jgi:hypothetical protein